MSMKNWPITQDGQAIDVTSASAATALSGANVLVAEDVLVDNPGPNDVWVRAGGASVVATLSSMRVPAGTLQPWRKGQGVTHLAFVAASGQTQSVVVHIGDGQ